MSINRKTYGTKAKWFNLIVYLLLIIGALTMLLPFLWMLSSSLKYNQEIFASPMRWIPESFRWSNYQEVWTRIPLATYYINTLKLTVIITAIQVITCSFAAFSFSKLNYPGRDKIFLLYLSTLMIPWHAIMIPQFIIVKNMGLYDTHLSLILLTAFNAFGVFLLRQNMLSIPSELSEAAKIDGCSEFGIYWRIIMPLTKAGLATLVIFTFTSTWNDYMGPLLYLDDDKLKTIQLGLAVFRNQYSTEYGLVMAGTVSSIIPIVIVYIFSQKYIIEGVASTGLKG